MARRIMTPEMKETLVELNEEGLTVPAIAKEMNVSAPTIYKYLELAGMQPNGRKAMEVDGPAVIAAYQDDSRSVMSVVNEFNISTTALYHILNKAGIPPRQKQPERMKAKEAQMDHALDLYQNSKMSVMKICLETGVSQPMLHRQIRERGIPFRNPKMASPVYDEEGKLLNEDWDD